MTWPLTWHIVVIMNDGHALDTKFNTLLREQIRGEFTASQQYIAVAVYFDGSDLPQLAAHFYAQAVEERNHAMMLVQYLLDRDLDVEIPGIDAVRSKFDSPPQALRLALDQERAVTEQITRLASVAREEGDYLGEQYMQWFLKEQVEEVATISSLVRIAERAGTNLFHLEDFVARELVGTTADPTAPKAAGGNL
jgi:bacterioferritin B